MEVRLLFAILNCKQFWTTGSCYSIFERTSVSIFLLHPVGDEMGLSLYARSFLYSYFFCLIYCALVNNRTNTAGFVIGILEQVCRAFTYIYGKVIKRGTQMHSENRSYEG